VENLLEQMLTEVGASQEQFLLAAKRGLESADKKYYEQLITCDNYLYFKNMMIKRNLQLEEQAFNLMTEKEVNGGNKVGTGNNSSIPNSKGKTNCEADYCNTNWKEIQKIREATELECAIQMSLALEEEKKRLMDIENDELMVIYSEFLFTRELLSYQKLKIIKKVNYHCLIQLL